MGDVYRARDPRLGRDVAIKLISETLATDASRDAAVRAGGARRRAAESSEHPGGLRRRHARRRALHRLRTARRRIAAQPSAAVARCHRAKRSTTRARLPRGSPPRTSENIVHRDVKPDNLFITSDGRIKILDFGIAKLTRPSDDTALQTGARDRDGSRDGRRHGGLHVAGAGARRSRRRRAPTSSASERSSTRCLTGRPAFTRDTAAETMTAILKDDAPALRAPDVPPSLARIVSRCLEKTREMRFQSARDLAFGLEMVSDTAATAMPAVAATPRRWRSALGPVLVVASLLIAAASWLLRGGSTPSIDDLLARATFTPFSNFDGSELDAAVSPDGRFVAFLSDRDGPYHLWLKQIGTGAFQDLTPDAADQRDQGPNRSVGFSADGSEIWGHGGNRLRLRPLTGGPAARLPHRQRGQRGLVTRWQSAGVLRLRAGRSDVHRRPDRWQRPADSGQRSWRSQPLSGLVAGRQVDLLHARDPGGHTSSISGGFPRPAERRNSSPTRAATSAM